eukprot:g1602.t1
MDDRDEKTKRTDIVKPSKLSLRIHNPIRAVVDSMNPSLANPNLELIPLSLGDPTVFGNFKQSDIMMRTLLSNARRGLANGYTHSAGHPNAREAVATCYNRQQRDVAYAPRDVAIASGCSGALDLAISVLLDPEHNILVPKPGFPLYETIAVARGASVRHYRLDPAQGWQADLKQLEASIDANTRALVLNNPSNPCGSVFPEKHVRDIVDIAKRHGLVIIADEIYGNMCFGDSSSSSFCPVASVSGDVPVLTVGGLAKEFLVPGWRVGWVLVCDRAGTCDALRPALQRLTQLTLGACTLVQSVLPSVLTPAAGSAEAKRLEQFRNAVNERLGEHAKFTCSYLERVPGLRVVRPRGAMYVMIGVEVERLGVADDVEFCDLLLKEEAVFVLPGQCFGVRNFFRVVFAAPMPMLKDAKRRSGTCDRAKEAEKKKERVRKLNEYGLTRANGTTQIRRCDANFQWKKLKDVPPWNHPFFCPHVPFVRIAEDPLSAKELEEWKSIEAGWDRLRTQLGLTFTPQPYGRIRSKSGGANLAWRDHAHWDPRLYIRTWRWFSRVLRRRFGTKRWFRMLTARAGKTGKAIPGTPCASLWLTKPKKAVEGPRARGVVGAHTDKDDRGVSFVLVLSGGGYRSVFENGHGRRRSITLRTGDILFGKFSSRKHWLADDSSVSLPPSAPARCVLVGYLPHKVFASGWPISPYKRRDAPVRNDEFINSVLRGVRGG